jgi:hypothetical protein
MMKKLAGLLCQVGFGLSSVGRIRPHGLRHIRVFLSNLNPVQDVRIQIGMFCLFILTPVFLMLRGQTGRNVLVVASGCGWIYIFDFSKVGQCKLMD